jgi:hypothetical protein
MPMGYLKLKLVCPAEILAIPLTEKMEKNCLQSDRIGANGGKRCPQHGLI